MVGTYMPKKKKIFSMREAPKKILHNLPFLYPGIAQPNQMGNFSTPNACNPGSQASLESHVPFPKQAII